MAIRRNKNKCNYDNVSAAPVDKYTKVPNELIENTELTSLEIRILMWMMGRPTGWRTNFTNLADKIYEGRSTIYAAVKRLKQKDYIRSYNIIDESGEIVDSFHAATYIAGIFERLPAKIAYINSLGNSVALDYNGNDNELDSPESGLLPSRIRTASVPNPVTNKTLKEDVISKKENTFSQQSAERDSDEPPPIQSRRRLGPGEYKHPVKEPEPVPKKESIKDQNKKQKDLELKEIYTPMSLELKEIISTREGYTIPYTVNIKQWAEQLRLIVVNDKVPLETVQVLLAWYRENINDTWTPQAFSGEAFRKKIEQLQAAYLRAGKPVMQINRGTYLKPNPDKFAKKKVYTLEELGM